MTLGDPRLRQGWLLRATADRHRTRLDTWRLSAGLTDGLPTSTPLRYPYGSGCPMSREHSLTEGRLTPHLSPRSSTERHRLRGPG